MFHAFGSNQFISELFDLRSASAHSEHLQTIVPVQMHMQTGYYNVAMLMLLISEHVFDVVAVMFVNKRDSTGDLSIAHLLAMLNKLRADHVSYCKGAVRVTLFLCHLVQLPCQTRWQRNRKPTNRSCLHTFHNLICITADHGKSSCFCAAGSYRYELGRLPRMFSWDFAL